MLEAAGLLELLLGLFAQLSGFVWVCLLSCLSFFGKNFVSLSWRLVLH
jgi:hypothetical protein